MLILIETWSNRNASGTNVEFEEEEEAAVLKSCRTTRVKSCSKVEMSLVISVHFLAMWAHYNWFCGAFGVSIKVVYVDIYDKSKNYFSCLVARGKSWRWSFRSSGGAHEEVPAACRSHGRSFSFVRLVAQIFVCLQFGNKYSKRQSVYC